MSFTLPFGGAGGGDGGIVCLTHLVISESLTSEFSISLSFLFS